ncbi:MAG TPA: hypothetical protein VGF59_32725 [Bryobacteraceae bacterium]
MAGAHGTRALGQANTGTTLQIDVENVVQYIQDVADVSKLASESNATPAVAGKNFRPFLVLGDIVAINGRPAKGTVAFHARQITLASAPTGGQGIADVVRGNANEQTFEIQRADGTPVGSIMAAGLGAGTAPPGSPLATAQGNNAIFGGTGAFLGVRGQAGRAVTPQDVPDRQASMAEDPANRRKNGGGKERFVLHIVPMSIPAIVNTPQGPAITHSSDFAVVTTAKPAAPGEILSLFATGLGPTHPGVEPGMPFPTGTLVDVNAPVEVTVNGTPAEVLSANGYPGGVNAYQLNFRIPSGTTPGTATIRLSAAWIAGGEAEIAIR